jgi:methylase of polypeptide subunit release factors
MTEKIFKPNLTTQLIISALRGFLENKKIANYLELGCGGGEITYSCLASLRNSKIVMTDISQKSIDLTIQRFKDNNINIDARKSDLFSAINPNEKFDLIVSDVASISDIFLPETDWYDGVSCDTGSDGLKLISLILENSKKFLNEGGAIIYPALNLSNTTKLKSLAELNFSNTTVLAGKDWPFKFNNPSFEFKLAEFKNKGLVDFKKMSGLHIFRTEVWMSF